MDGGAWWASVHGATESRTRWEGLSAHCPGVSSRGQDPPPAPRAESEMGGWERHPAPRIPQEGRSGKAGWCREA